MTSQGLEIPTEDYDLFAAWLLLLNNVPIT